MFTSEDLASPERTEIKRRSIAMLKTGAWAVRREDAMLMLDRLIELLKQERARQG